MQEQVERFSLLSSLQGIVPPSCRQQSCSLSSFAALSGCFQTRTRRSWPSGRSGRACTESPTTIRWDRSDLKPRETTCALSEPDPHCVFHLLCRRTCRESSSGKGTSIRLKKTTKVFYWVPSILWWPWTNTETWWEPKLSQSLNNLTVNLSLEVRSYWSWSTKTQLQSCICFFFYLFKLHNF